MELKKLMLFTGTFLILCLFITNVVLPTLPKAKADNGEQSQNNSEFQQKQDSGTEIAYILSVFDGRVAVFKADGQQPLFTTDTRVSDLPPSDKASLEKGIEVRDREELNQFLEDFCS